MKKAEDRLRKAETIAILAIAALIAVAYLVSRF